MTFAELSRTAQTVSAACLTLLAALSAATCAAEKPGQTACRTDSAKKPFHPTPAREACVKKRANGLLPAACGIILLALSFVLLTWIPPGTMEGSAMLCFALGTMVLFLPGRWTSALSPAAAV